MINQSTASGRVPFSLTRVALVLQLLQNILHILPIPLLPLCFLQPRDYALQVTDITFFLAALAEVFEGLHADIGIVLLFVKDLLI